jgi:hypothetical protein
MTASTQRLKRSALCSISNQKRRAANGKALTCEKTRTGKLCRRSSRAV